MKIQYPVPPARFYRADSLTTSDSPTLLSSQWLKLNPQGFWEYSQTIDSRLPVVEIVALYMQRTFCQQDYLKTIIKSHVKVYNEYHARVVALEKHPHWHMELHARGLHKFVICGIWLCFAMWLSYRRQEEFAPEVLFDALARFIPAIKSSRYRVLKNLNIEAIHGLLGQQFGSGEANFNINYLKNFLYKTNKW